MVRCIPCGARFLLAQPGGSLEPGPVTASGARPASLLDREPAGSAAASAAHGNDLDLATFGGRSPSDWRDDMGGVLGGDPEDSQVELPAFTSESGSSGEVQAAAPFDTASSEFFTVAPWYYAFIESTTRVFLYAAVGFAAASLAAFGFLLLRTLRAGYIMSTSTTALIIGCIATIAFLLLALPATAVVVLLVDLARNLRLLVEQTGRNPTAAINSNGQSRTSLSHPVR
jgi:hypothetical protein